MDGPLRSISPWPAAAMMLVVLLLTSCDGYIEQVRVDEGGSVEFAAEATVVCGDELQAALWDEAPCDAIDRAVRGEAIARLPFDFVVDDRRLGLVADGEQDRRRIDATWEGTIDELDTLLVSDASIRSLGDGEVEVVFTPAGAPQDVLATVYHHLGIEGSSRCFRCRRFNLAPG